MATKKDRVAIGVFDSPAKAQQAVNELRRMGFREDQIGVAGKHVDDISGATSVEDTPTDPAYPREVSVPARFGPAEVRR
jgi:hypothetical protein